MLNIIQKLKKMMPVSNYRNINISFIFIMIIFIALIWFHYLKLIDFEYHQDINAISTSDSNLVKALDENTRRNFENIDEVLTTIKQAYEKTDSITSETINRLTSARVLPLLYIVVLDETGKIIAGSKTELLNQNRSSTDFFQQNKVKDYQQLLVTKAIQEKIVFDTETWTFHISLRLNRLDGSFSGVVVAAVDPLYFSKLFRQMGLKNNSTITIVDLEKNVLARQVGDTFSAGMNIDGAGLFDHLKEADRGTYITISAIDQVSRIISYNRMSD